MGDRVTFEEIVAGMTIQKMGFPFTTYFIRRKHENGLSVGTLEREGGNLTREHIEAVGYEVVTMDGGDSWRCPHCSYNKRQSTVSADGVETVRCARCSERIQIIRPADKGGDQ